ncbi:hypothetical protein SPRG_11198 [Saprolegnia parasitica CBS 223.65]|uniref:PX domain-containing protein n=1 Tax=Saprolegnia parasitica (strain CBS 223.65) TaxID=695850 RepID=A0A067BYD9_SAPPC|nr:hypothetical protein SPRG_11198 [Saprolegnia parasitica CBS 223.65]KDO23268.1 hypothetical protein SPRG_11198 [Saprolegnia parasitica CBS 223.65]|eukprot:XP_012206056.1 hypothetical protein SPRG_11198 [Saprolegnia parasitica CBS 223.65]
MGCTTSRAVDDLSIAAVAASESAAASDVATPESAHARRDVGKEAARDKTFVITGHSVRNDGVVVYHISMPNSPDEIQRRFRDFKRLHGELKDVVLEEAEDCGVAIPDLPYNGLLTKLQRQHTRDLDERKEKLGELLEAAASHPVTRNSKGFQKFITLDMAP